MLPAPAPEEFQDAGSIATLPPMFQGVASDGEYLILVEDDFKAKNVLYRWRP